MNDLRFVIYGNRYRGLLVYRVANSKVSIEIITVGQNPRVLELETSREPDFSAKRNFQSRTTNSTRTSKVGPLNIEKFNARTNPRKPGPPGWITYESVCQLG